MEPFLSLAIATAMAGALAALAARDHRRQRQGRRALLDGCAALFSSAELSHGGDDFPRLEGTHKGRRVVAELIPDTMTIKRLPQLWLSLSVYEALPVTASFAILVRPSGNDFYSLTERLVTTLRPPRDLPWEVLVRGSGSNPQALLERMAPALGAILADARIKEIAVTPNGMRLIRQAGEGRRGEHLLLRQAVFEDAAVTASDLQNLLGILGVLRDRLPATHMPANAARRAEAVA